jgi:phospholipid/cholesterol/gamma-HCH transport system permease protein
MKKIQNTKYKNILNLINLENFFIEIYYLFSMFWEIVIWTMLILLKKKKFDKKTFINQFYEVGVSSFPIILITAFATGMVLALQLGLVMKNWFGDPIFVGMTVSFTFAKELSPVLTSIVMAGRIGAAITAEIGTMKVTEQLDAMSSLGVHPLQYLAVPKFLSCLLMIPFLSILSYIISVFGGLLVAVKILEIPYTVYLSDAFNMMSVSTILHGFIKAFFFGMIVSWISIYKGFTCKEGAEGVGKATTSSVVLSIILILISDYFLTTLLVAFKIS